MGICWSGSGYHRLGRARSDLPLLRHVQLVINTGTTIVTFLIFFLIKNTQNRDARAINLKLNELIRAIDKARDQMIDIENLSDLELDELQAKYEKIKAECNERQGRNRAGTLQDVND